MTSFSTGMYSGTLFPPFAHIKCLLECKESRWEVVSYVLVGSQDTMEIDCMWNHYFLTVIDAQSLCILSSLL